MTVNGDEPSRPRARRPLLFLARRLSCSMSLRLTPGCRIASFTFPGAARFSTSTRRRGQVMRELLAEFSDPDGNFVQQFQTYGFDQRIFELYLDALFREAGAKIDRSHDRPDFTLSKDGKEVVAYVEATTANPDTGRADEAL